jgi:lipopolysaccharide export system protein LptA
MPPSKAQLVAAGVLAAVATALAVKTLTAPSTSEESKQPVTVEALKAESPEV